MAAVVFSDAVGFSARMAADESRTLTLVERDLQLMRQICQERRGRVLKSTGDGLLMYFDDALEAVTCALQIQRRLGEQAKTLPDEEVLDHRIGIHLGHVYLKDHDIMGNGVNIAARLQTQAEPGGICLSKTVYDHVQKTLSVKATYLGLRELKNISDGFPVYQILLDSPRNPSWRRSPSSPRRDGYRNRQVLLDKVSHYWIQGVLETSLQGRVTMELGLEAREDLLDHPWSFVWRREDDGQPLPANTRAIDKFDELGSCRTLLILGEPGSGKTTTLLDIARELIERAKYDVTLAIPVVFNLSSWLGKRETIKDWLVTELNTKYQVRRKTATTWIEEQQLLLLLDGLDEVDARRREACVAALNQFCQDHGETELIVCSRMYDYEALDNRLLFQGAIYLQPLTSEQIREYFVKAGERLGTIAEAMEEDETLQELGRSPLMLSIMSLAYEGVPASELRDDSSLEKRHQHLFDCYIARMLARRFGEKPYRDEQMKAWLGYLAQQLVQDSQTVFLIEGIQRSWLRTQAEALEYHLKLCGITGAVFGTIAGLVAPYVWETELAGDLRLIGGLGSGAILGLISALCWTGFRHGLGRRVTSPLGMLSGSAIAGLIALILGWGLSGIYDVLTPVGFIPLFGRPENFLLFYVLYTSVALLFWRLLRPIRPASSLRWSWPAAKHRVLDGMLVGLGIGVVGGGMWVVNAMSMVLDMSGGTVHHPFGIPVVWPLLLGVPWALLGQLLGGAIALLIGGFTGLEEARTTKPNQGIWQALRNALIVGGFAMVILGTLSGLVWGSVVSGLALGVAVGVFGGGLVALKHLLLRMQLRSLGRMPWNYAHFLDYATSCIFLQKMGGGYIFVHRLLLEHFARLHLLAKGKVS